MNKYFIRLLTSIIILSSIQFQICGASCNDAVINVLKQKNIISEHQNYDPEKYITRGEYAMMIYHLIGIEMPTENRFSDISEGELLQASNILNRLGILTGYENQFSPEKTLSKLEAVAAAVRIYEFQNESEVIIADDDVLESGMEDWAKDITFKAKKYGFLKKNDIATAPVTFGEAAELIYNVLLSLNESDFIENCQNTLLTKIKQTELGNLFYSNVQPSFIIDTGYKTIRMVAVNYYGVVTADIAVAIAKKDQLITLPSVPNGFYHLYIYGNDNKNKMRQIGETFFAVMDEYDFMTVESRDFGICTHFPRTKYGWSLDLMEAAYKMGARGIRDAFDWGNVENKKGVYACDITPTVERLRKYKMDYLVASGFNNLLYDNGMTPYTREGFEGFANYITNFLSMIGEEATIVDVYNEFWGLNFGGRNNSPAQSRPSYYYELLKKTYEVAKKGHPNVKFLSNTINRPSASNAGPVGWEIWYSELLKLGAAKYLDGIFYHRYYAQEIPEVVLKRELEKTIQDNRTYAGRDIPIYITETGVSTTNRTEREQAQYVPRAYAIAKSYDVERVYWYDLMDDGLDANNNENNFGYLRHLQSNYGAYTPKPAYVAYAAMTRQLSDKKLVQFNNSDNIYKYCFAKDNDYVTMLWSSQGSKDITIFTDKPVEIVDIMGNSKRYVPFNGCVYLTVSEDVLYIKAKDIMYEESIPFQKTASDTSQYENAKIAFETKLDANIEISTNGIKNTMENGTLQQSVKISNQSERINLLSDIYINGQLGGTLKSVISVYDSNEILVEPYMEYIENNLGGLRVKLKNNSSDSAFLRGVTCENSDGSQTAVEINKIINAADELDFDIPLGKVERMMPYEYDLHLDINGRANTNVKVQAEFNPCEKKTIKLDGIIDDLQLAPSAILKIDNWVALLKGVDAINDISANAWFEYDEDNLYLSAIVKDNVHSALSEVSRLYEDDSMQFAFCAPSVDGYSDSKYFEFGVRLKENQADIWRYKGIEGFGAGAPENIKVAASRNEVTKTTTYEVSIPWKELNVSDLNSLATFKFSLLINDNDGGGRKGFLEWGSGIGTVKNPALFRKVLIVKD